MLYYYCEDCGIKLFNEHVVNGRIEIKCRKCNFLNVIDRDGGEDRNDGKWGKVKKALDKEE